jgi:hypothetical protein
MTTAFPLDRAIEQPVASDALATALEQLRDIHLPDAVPMWPPAPGWWFAFGLLVFAATLIFLRLRAHRRSLRRAALRELDTMEHSYRITADVAVLARRLSALLRRTALARFGHSRVAGLHGQEWIEFLAATTPAGAAAVASADALTRTMYARPGGESDTRQGETWIADVRAWIRSLS